MKKQVESCPDVRIAQGLVSRLPNGLRGFNSLCGHKSAVYGKQRSDYAETGQKARPISSYSSVAEHRPAVGEAGSIPVMSFLLFYYKTHKKASGLQ